MDEAKAKRDYKAEYKKFQSSTKAKKYRAELNKYNRKKGTYGNGDGKDASHKGGKIVGFEAQSKNRGRKEKSRLKKESTFSVKIDTFQNALKSLDKLSDILKKGGEKKKSTMVSKLIKQLQQAFFRKEMMESIMKEGKLETLALNLLRDMNKNLGIQKYDHKKGTTHFKKVLRFLQKKMPRVPMRKLGDIAMSYDNYRKKQPKATIPDIDSVKDMEKTLKKLGMKESVKENVNILNELRIDLPNFDYEKHKRDIFGLFNKLKIKGMLGDRQGKTNWLVLKDKDDWKKAEPILKKLKIKYKLKEAVDEHHQAITRFILTALSKAGIKIRKVQMMKKSWLQGKYWYGGFFTVRAQSGNDVLPFYVDKKGNVNLQVSPKDYIIGKYPNMSTLVQNLKDFKKTDLDESVNESAWTPAQEKAVKELDKKFYKLIGKKGIEPYSVEASRMWTSGGFRDEMKKIFGKNESVNENTEKAVRLMMKRGSIKKGQSTDDRVSSISKWLSKYAEKDLPDQYSSSKIRRIQMRSNSYAQDWWGDTLYIARSILKESINEREMSIKDAFKDLVKDHGAKKALDILTSVLTGGIGFEDPKKKKQFQQKLLKKMTRESANEIIEGLGDKMSKISKKYAKGQKKSQKALKNKKGPYQEEMNETPYELGGMKVYSKADGLKKVKSMQKTDGAKIYKVTKTKTKLYGKHPVTMYNLHTKNKNHSTRQNPYGLDMMKGVYLIPVKESIKEFKNMSPGLKKALAQKGYGPLFFTIDQSKRQLKQMKYTKAEIEDTLFTMFGDQDPKIVKKIKESKIKESKKLKVIKGDVLIDYLKDRLDYTTKQAIKIQKKLPGGLKVQVNEKKGDWFNSLFPKSKVQKAIEIAKEMGGNMTGATKKIEKFFPGMILNTDVQDALRKYNESVNEANSKIKDFRVIVKQNKAKRVDNMNIDVDTAKAIIKKYKSLGKHQKQKFITQKLKNIVKFVNESINEEKYVVYVDKDGKGRKGRKIVKSDLTYNSAKRLSNKLAKTDDYQEVGFDDHKSWNQNNIEKLNERMDKRQAAVTLKQLGGNKFIAMTGAKNFGFGSNGLSFKIGRNAKAVNYVVIDLNGKDLYDIKFQKGTRVLKQVNDVYADQLQKIFTKYTGMYTSL